MLTHVRVQSTHQNRKYCRHSSHLSHELIAHARPLPRQLAVTPTVPRKHQ